MMKSSLKYSRPKWFHLIVVLWLACAANLAAQSNQTVDRLLGRKARDLRRYRIRHPVCRGICP